MVRSPWRRVSHLVLPHHDILDGVDAAALLLAGTTLAASFGGYVLAGFNESRRDVRTARRERETRAEEARLRREEDRHRLQLEALMALQEDVQRLARQCGRALHFDHMQARQGHYTQLPEPWSDEELETRLSLKRNISRVLDDGVRVAVDHFSDITAKVSLDFAALEDLSGPTLEEAAAARMGPLFPATEDAHEAIGVALRREISWEPIPASTNSRSPGS